MMQAISQRSAAFDGKDNAACSLTAKQEGYQRTRSEVVLGRRRSDCSIMLLLVYRDRCRSEALGVLLAGVEMCA